MIQIQALPGGGGIHPATGPTRHGAVPDRTVPRAVPDRTAPRPRALRAADEPDDQRPRPAPRPCGGARLEVLGGFSLSIDGEDISPGIGARRLLALLAVEPGGLTRARAAAVLWPGLDAARAGAALRTALHRLPGSRTDLLHEAGERLRLAPDVTTDLAPLRDTATRVLNLSLPLDADELGRAVGCDFGHDLLPDWEEDWLDHHRVRWREQRLHTLEALSFRLVQAGWVGAAVDAALVAIQADNLRESAHETLVAAYLAAGNRIAAQAYRTSYREQLRQELAGREPAVRPSPAPEPGRPAAPRAEAADPVRSLRSLRRRTARHQDGR